MKLANLSPRRLAPLFVIAACAVTAQPAVAANPVMPGGDWRQTCEDASIRGNTLFARCRQDNGQYRSTSALLLGNCQSYSNRNGELTCERNGNTVANSRWNGSYGESCRNIAVDKHGRLSADCRRPKGKWHRSNITPQQCPSYQAGNRDGKLYCESESNLASRWDGSFQKSCREIGMDSSGTLTASCQAMNGSWQRTSLGARQCNSYRAGNNNGQLVCETGDSVSNRWQGSFKNSCRDSRMDASGSLTATCQSSNGMWRPSSLAANQCNSYRAGNNNGQLVCESQESASNRWEGSFQRSCRDIGMDTSGTLTATCQAANGNWQRSSLGSRQCNSYRAGNNNGQLVCESQESASNRWEGSFQRSCRDIGMDSSGTLTASCQAANGSWQRSSLGSRQCNGYRAGNNNGQLVCESGERVSNRWQGSFRNSCREGNVDASGSLTATCQASNGTWRTSSLAANQCNTNRAGNNNGQLVCESQDTTVSQWQGSFMNSCRDISTDSAGSLTATCQTMNGNWQRSSLGSRQCSNDRAGNNNGQLVCES